MTTDVALDYTRGHAPICAPIPVQPNSLRYPRRVDPPSDVAGDYPLISRFARDVHTRVATTVEQLEAAAELVRRRYAWRGYECDTEARNEAGELTLMTSEQDAPAGTLTLRPDGPRGLRADSGFRRELEGLRRLGRLGEVTRLALETEADSKAVLASLFCVGHWIFRFHHGVTHVVIEVNPRHVPFYRRALGFAVASKERICERVGAPGVLLAASIHVIGQRTAAFSARAAQASGAEAPVVLGTA
jgi:hypothetical protein